MNAFPHDVLLDYRFRRDVERLHALGPRPLAELLAELAEAHSIRTSIDQRLARYGNLDPEILRALGGDRFPVPPLYEVAARMDLNALDAHDHDETDRARPVEALRGTR